MFAPLRKKFLRANHVPYIAKFYTLQNLRVDLYLRQSTSKLNHKPTSNYPKNAEKTFVVSYTREKEENCMSH